jgi:hypothetical protein
MGQRKKLLLLIHEKTAPQVPQVSGGLLDSTNGTSGFANSKTATNAGSGFK